MSNKGGRDCDGRHRGQDAGEGGLPSKAGEGLYNECGRGPEGGKSNASSRQQPTNRLAGRSRWDL